MVLWFLRAMYQIYGILWYFMGIVDDWLSHINGDLHNRPFPSLSTLAYTLYVAVSQDWARQNNHFSLFTVW